MEISSSIKLINNISNATLIAISTACNKPPPVTNLYLKTI